MTSDGIYEHVPPPNHQHLQKGHTTLKIGHSMVSGNGEEISWNRFDSRHIFIRCTNQTAYIAFHVSTSFTAHMYPKFVNPSLDIARGIGS